MSNYKSWDEIEKTPEPSNVNIAVNEGFSQVCVWPGTVLEKEQITEMEAWFLSEFKTRIQFLEVILTKPGDGEEGGRSDVFFAVHNEDIGKFSVPRLQIGVRWIEDVLSKTNYRSPIYPSRVYNYKTWEA